MHNPNSKSSPAPSDLPAAAAGNPAYPSLQAREKLIAENKKHPEIVKKIPADQLKKHGTPSRKIP